MCNHLPPPKGYYELADWRRLDIGDLVRSDDHQWMPLRRIDIGEMVSKTNYIAACRPCIPMIEYRLKKMC